MTLISVTQIVIDFVVLHPELFVVVTVNVYVPATIGVNVGDELVVLLNKAVLVPVQTKVNGAPVVGVVTCNLVLCAP